VSGHFIIIFSSFYSRSAFFTSHLYWESRAFWEHVFTKPKTRERGDKFTLLIRQNEFPQSMAAFEKLVSLYQCMRIHKNRRTGTFNRARLAGTQMLLRDFSVSNGLVTKVINSKQFTWQEILRFTEDIHDFPCISLNKVNISHDVSSYDATNSR
jgi:hypothetical protein